MIRPSVCVRWRVASEHIAALSQRGINIAVDIPLSKLEATKPDPEDWLYNWPADLDPKDLPGDISNINIFKLEEKTYRVTMHFRHMDKLRKTLEAGLTIDSLDTPNPDSSHTEMHFTLDYFNFPLIDNTSLPDNQRIALVLENFGQTKITVRAILFPGIYASQHDKPFLNEAIRQLDRQRGKLIEKGEGTTIF